MVKTFSILLISNSSADVDRVVRMIKRHFPALEIAKTENEALKKLEKKAYDVVIFSFDEVKEAEVCFLHITHKNSNKNNILYSIIFCNKEQSQEAFRACNKDIFNDYFILTPLYDPYHILLRLRTLKRLKADGAISKPAPMDVNQVCEFLDNVILQGQTLISASDEGFERLYETARFSVEKLAETLDSTNENAALSTKLQQEIIQEKNHSKELVKERAEFVISQSQQLQETVLNEESKEYLSSSKILLICHDDDTVFSIRKTLITAGYNLSISRRGMEGYKLLQDGKFDIVILDLSLSDVSPLFIISNVVEQSKLRTHIIALSSKGNMSIVDEILKMGVKDIMLKPAEPKILMDKIESFSQDS